MTDDLNAPFEPDWISPPGDSIADAAEERGWTQVELAQRLGYSEKHISQLINGKVPVTTDTAQRLQRVIGSTVEFWLAREANYQRHKARLEAQRKHAEWVPWLEHLPVKALMDSGTLPKLRQDAKNKPTLVVVPALPRAHVSGVARWLNDRAVIQLSLYGKTNDRFWFTFFHEAAHILLHAGSREARKSVFLDDLSAPSTDNPQEQEANTWASHWLIPPELQLNEFKTSFSLQR